MEQLRGLVAQAFAVSNGLPSEMGETIMQRTGATTPLSANNVVTRRSAFSEGAFTSRSCSAAVQAAWPQPSVKIIVPFGARHTDSDLSLN